MATSVPVPIARPRSACASAGASLTPSPTMATTRPSACRRRTTPALSAGSTSAMTSSMPTSRRDRPRPSAALSPVSSTGRRPERAQLGDRGRARGLDGVGDDEQAARRAVPGGGDCGPAARPRPRARARVELGGQRAAPSRRAGRAADDDRVALDDALDAEALAVARRPRPPAARRARSRAALAMARAIGCSEASSSAPARRSSSPRSIAAGDDRRRRSAMRPVVTVPVLSSTIVSTRRVDSSTSGPLIRMPSWAPRPVPTSSAVGVASPSAHGQAMISTATAAVNANAALAPPPSQKPSVATASAITIGHEDAGDAVGEPLHGRLARLRLGHEARRSARARCRRRPAWRARRAGRRR